jgi:uncharacterized cupin superfamily protein
LENIMSATKTPLVSSIQPANPNAPAYIATPGHKQRMTEQAREAAAILAGESVLGRAYLIGVRSAIAHGPLLPAERADFTGKWETKSATDKTLVPSGACDSYVSRVNTGPKAAKIIGQKNALAIVDSIEKSPPIGVRMYEACAVAFRAIVAAAKDDGDTTKASAPQVVAFTAAARDAVKARVAKLANEDKTAKTTRKPATTASASVTLAPCALAVADACRKSESELPFAQQRASLRALSVQFESQCKQGMPKQTAAVVARISASFTTLCKDFGVLVQAEGKDAAPQDKPQSRGQKAAATRRANRK